MSPFDVPPDEMGRDPNITDEELQALLDGRPAAAAGDLARFVDDLRATFPADAPATEAHLAAIMETTHLFADNGDPVARPVSNADAPVAQVSRLPKRRENRMKDHKWRILVLRVAAPIVALFTVLGIMGSAGALPRGLQRLTSHAAGLVGFELPSGEDSEAGDDQGENTDDQGEDTSKDDSTTVEGDQGENDNSQGDSTSVDPTNQDDQGDSTDTSTSTEGDQGENDNSQGDSTSVDPTNQDDQGENDQGSTTSQDDQGDNSQDEGSSGSSQDDQGDNSGNTSSDDSGSGSTGSGSGGNNQN